MSAAGFVEQLWDSARFWRGAAAVLATAGFALLVAALVARAPPDFAERPVIAVLRDTGQHPAWAIRLAPAAHQIAVDSLGPPPPPAGKVYQLWLVAPGVPAPQPLGLLPLSGRKIIAETSDEYPAFGRQRRTRGHARTGETARLPSARADRRCSAAGSTMPDYSLTEASRRLIKNHCSSFFKPSQRACATRRRKRA